MTRMKQSKRVSILFISMYRQVRQKRRPLRNPARLRTGIYRTNIAVGMKIPNHSGVYEGFNFSNTHKQNTKQGIF